MQESQKDQSHLSPIQIRVLACLMEKHLATPKGYPLSPNSLTLACNQKSNRDPVMNLTEGQVMHCVNELVEKKLAYIDYGSRTNKVSHRAPGELEVDRKQQAILCMLMLRTPLTLNEIKARTERMVQFDSIDDLKENLEELITRPEPLVILIPKAQGRREERSTHLLAGEPNISEITLHKTPQAKNKNNAAADKIEELEKRIARLEQQMQELLN